MPQARHGRPPYLGRRGCNLSSQATSGNESDTIAAVISPCSATIRKNCRSDFASTTYGALYSAKSESCRCAQRQEHRLVANEGPLCRRISPSPARFGPTTPKLIGPRWLRSIRPKRASSVTVHRCCGGDGQHWCVSTGETVRERRRAVSSLPIRRRSCGLLLLDARLVARGHAREGRGGHHIRAACGRIRGRAMKPRRPLAGGD